MASTLFYLSSLEWCLSLKFLAFFKFHLIKIKTRYKTENNQTKSKMN